MTSLLSEILSDLENKANELEVEGINCVDYFAHRLGITDKELLAFAEKRSKENYRDASTMGEALISGWLEAFMVGIMAGRRRGAWRN